jgi:hypothetical protein
VLCGLISLAVSLWTRKKKKEGDSEKREWKDVPAMYNQQPFVGL